MLFLSGRGTAGAGPSGWTRIAPWMRTTGDTGKGSRGKSEWRQCPVFHTHTQALKGWGPQWQ